MDVMKDGLRSCSLGVSRVSRPISIIMNMTEYQLRFYHALSIRNHNCANPRRRKYA